MKTIIDTLVLVDERASIILVLMVACLGLAYLFIHERKAKERVIERSMEANQETLRAMNEVISSLDRMRDMLMLVLPQVRDRGGGDSDAA